VAEELDSIEIIVVDDGSTDRSADVAESFGPGVRCLRREARGLAAARNAGWNQALAPFVMHLDADDLVVRGSISPRLAVLTGNPEVDMVTGHFESFFSPDLDAEARARIALPDGPRRGHIAGSTILRRNLIERVGPLDEASGGAADIDWYARATEAGIGIVVLPDVVLLRRIHGRNLNLTSSDQSIDRLRMVKAALDRRRAAASKPPA
jgi:glycosyltransferase involved in cell wall biosynthesis